MCLFHKRLLLILFCMLASPISLAEGETCILNGFWTDTAAKPNVNEALYFRQIGETVTGEASFPHHYFAACSSDFDVTGTINAATNTFVLNFKSLSKQTDAENCDLKFTGSFVGEGCSAVAGYWQAEGEQTQTPFEWISPLEIYEPEIEKDLIITAEPRMPRVIAKVRARQGPSLSTRLNLIPSYKWSVNTFYKVGDTDRKLDENLPPGPIKTDVPRYEIDFSQYDGFRGGSLTLLVEHDGYWMTQAAERFTIKGTNPGKERIEQVLTSPVLRHIACQESKYKQFEASREGGVGFPLVGVDVKSKKKIGGIGMMQVYYPWNKKDPDNDKKPHLSAKSHWDWRENIKEGMKLFIEKEQAAKKWHMKERKKLNRERAAKGLPACPEGTPPQLTSAQLEREILRRYNGGYEYRWLPRDAPDCKGQWVIDSACSNGKVKNCDLNYVDKVLKCNI